MVTGGTLFEELGFYYVGPIDGHNIDQLLPVLKNVRDSKTGPIIVHCRTQKGKGYGPAETVRRQVSRRGQVRRRDRRPGQGQVERPGLPEGVRREPDQGSPEGRQDHRHHRRHAVGHRHRSVREGLPGAHLRRRHRRAARGDVRRGPCDRGLQAVLRDLFDLPAARLRPGRARRRDPAAAGALCHGPRRPRRRRRTDPCRLVRPRLSRLPAGLRHHGGRRRGGPGAHGGDAGRDRRPPVGAALSARRRRRRRDAGRRQAARDRQGPHHPRGQQDRASCRSARGSRNR